MMLRSRGFTQWQGLRVLTVLAVMSNIESVLGQLQSRTTYPAPIVVPSSESWFVFTNLICAIALLTQLGMVMTAPGLHSSFRSEHLRRQSNFFHQLPRMRHGRSHLKDVNQESPPTATH